MSAQPRLPPIHEQGACPYGHPAEVTSAPSSENHTACQAHRRERHVPARHGPKPLLRRRSAAASRARPTALTRAFVHASRFCFPSLPHRVAHLPARMAGLAMPRSWTTPTTLSHKRAHFRPGRWPSSTPPTRRATIGPPSQRSLGHAALQLITHLTGAVREHVGVRQLGAAALSTCGHSRRNCRRLPPTTKRTLQRAYGRFPWLTATAQNRRDSGALEGNRTTTPVARPSPPSRPGCRSPR